MVAAGAAASAQEFYWSRVQQGTKCPEARWKHSALLIDDTRILVFGGFKNNSMRYAALTTYHVQRLTSLLKQP